MIHTLEVLALAVALAMDAMTVALATGMSLKKINFRQTFRLSWHFGLFQFIMPVIGWAAGLSFRSMIEDYDHWVAFVLLAFIGGKMIREAWHPDKEGRAKHDATRGLTLVILSVATSLDALAVGLSLAMLGWSIWYPALIIGLVAAFLTGAGLHLGRLLGAAPRLSRYAETIGGVVLIVIGLKILHEHGVM